LNGNGIWPYTQTGSCDMELGVQQQVAVQREAAVYPQPFTIQTSIRLPEPVSGAIFSVYAFDGSCVYAERVRGTQIEFRNPNLTPGVYCFRVVTAEKVYSGRLVITSE
ncbi:MAG: T9SS type A sorting domain-containing protein, partial [Bacteroidia bacterium]